jgi:hypothetical protein
MIPPWSIWSFYINPFPDTILAKRAKNLLPHAFLLLLTLKH